MGVMRTTMTEFLNPSREFSGPLAAHNGPDNMVCKSRGILTHIISTREDRQAGVHRTDAWRWTGKLPRSVKPQPNWTLRAAVDGEDKEFQPDTVIKRGGAWIIEMRETSLGDSN